MNLELLDSVTLLWGNHDTRDDGVCALELVAWMAGEPHTDHPKCVSPVLGAFVRTWNDDLDDANRQRLKPYLPRLIGTAGDAVADERRAWMATDWMVRTFAPAWLRLAKLEEHAATLEALPPILSAEAVEVARPTLVAAGEAAAAAGAAAGDAVMATAWDALIAAARDAAWAAARDAAWAPARAVAWAAAWTAVWAAEGAAAEQALAPTRDRLIESAFGLLDRMIEARA